MNYVVLSLLTFCVLQICGCQETENVKPVDQDIVIKYSNEIEHFAGVGTDGKAMFTKYTGKKALYGRK